MSELQDAVFIHGGVIVGNKSGGSSGDNSINATVETSPATASHDVGDYIYYNNIVYKVKASIAIGDNLVVNTNIEEPTLPDNTVVYIPNLSGNVDANSVSYDHTTSELTADNVQDAIDEVVTKVEAIDAYSVSYNNTDSGLEADNVQDAIDEVAASAAGAVTATSDVLDSKILANATTVATLGDRQVRNIYAGTADMTAGVSVLASGDIYIVYEA